MSLKQNQSINMESSKYNNTITSVAYMLGISPDAVNAWVNSKEFEHIQNIEREKLNLTNTVHRIMSDRLRIKEEIDKLFEKVKA
jgi:predicted transcriptional regulator